MNLPDFLTEWPFDTIVLKGHRIGLYHIIRDHLEGKTLADRREWYPDLSPELIEKVLEFYRENKAEVDDYVTRYAEELRRQEANHPPVFNLDELRRRAEAKKQAGR